MTSSTELKDSIVSSDGNIISFADSSEVTTIAFALVGDDSDFGISLLEVSIQSGGSGYVSTDSMDDSGSSPVITLLISL